MTGFRPLLTPNLAGWRMAGAGGFAWVEEEGGPALESHGGHGLLWHADTVFADVALQVDWRCLDPTDNSGVFLRILPLADDPQPAIADGYEVQIDDRGVAPDGSTGSPLHLTGAVYTLAPATVPAFRPTGEWNRFLVTARGGDIAVILNGLAVARLVGGTRRREGHIALQAHHDGSRVRFRNLLVRPLDS